MYIHLGICVEMGCIHVCVRASILMCVWQNIYVCACVCVCVHMCVCICICVHTNICWVKALGLYIYSAYVWVGVVEGMHELCVSVSFSNRNTTN